MSAKSNTKSTKSNKLNQPNRLNKSNKKDKSSKVLIITLIITIALVLIIFGSLCYYYFNYDKPVNVVYKLVNGINEKDIQSIVECLDPKQEMTYKGVSAIISKVIGYDMSDIVNLVPFLFDIMSNQGHYSNLHVNIIEITSEEINGNNAVITAFVELEITDKDNNIRKETGTEVFHLKKFSKGWRVVDFFD